MILRKSYSSEDSRCIPLGNKHYLSRSTSEASLGGYGTRSFCSARWVLLEVRCYREVFALELTFGFLGIEEALVGTLVAQQSFITDFGLDNMSADQRAETVGNVVSMSQLGCIAGALL